MLFYQQIANIISARELIVAGPHVQLTSPVSHIHLSSIQSVRGSCPEVEIICQIL